MGLEIECFYIAEDEVYTNGSANVVNMVNVYAYEYNDNVFFIKERQLPKHKNFKPGETNLTVLIDPEKSEKAIVKENFFIL